MKKVELRLQRVSDAKIFYEILSNPKFIFFATDPKSVEDERKWLKERPEKRKANLEYDYAILYGGKLVGGCGIKVRHHRKFIGEEEV